VKPTFQFPLVQTPSVLCYLRCSSKRHVSRRIVSGFKFTRPKMVVPGWPSRFLVRFPILHLFSSCISSPVYTILMNKQLRCVFDFGDDADSQDLRTVPTAATTTIPFNLFSLGSGESDIKVPHILLYLVHFISSWLSIFSLR